MQVGDRICFYEQSVRFQGEIIEIASIDPNLMVVKADLYAKGFNCKPQKGACVPVHRKQCRKLKKKPPPPPPLGAPKEIWVRVTTLPNVERRRFLGEAWATERIPIPAHLASLRWDKYVLAE